MQCSRDGSMSLLPGLASHPPGPLPLGFLVPPIISTHTYPGVLRTGCNEERWHHKDRHREGTHCRGAAFMCLARTVVTVAWLCVGISGLVIALGPAMGTLVVKSIQHTPRVLETTKVDPSIVFIVQTRGDDRAWCSFFLTAAHQHVCTRSKGLPRSVLTGQFVSRWDRKTESKAAAASCSVYVRIYLF
jgi:hypothetical protein